MAAPSVRSLRPALPLLLLAVVVAASLCGGASASAAATASSESSSATGTRAASIAATDKCRLETDCTANHYCSLSYDATTDAVIGECRANPFFSNFSWRQGVTLALVFLTAFIAAGSGGTGVGSVHIPVLLSVMALTATESVVSAQVRLGFHLLVVSAFTAWALTFYPHFAHFCAIPGRDLRRLTRRHHHVLVRGSPQCAAPLSV